MAPLIFETLTTVKQNPELDLHNPRPHHKDADAAPPHPPTPGDVFNPAISHSFAFSLHTSYMRTTREPSLIKAPKFRREVEGFREPYKRLKVNDTVADESQAIADES
jgi:hypothetical protein